MSLREEYFKQMIADQKIVEFRKNTDKTGHSFIFIFQEQKSQS